MNGETSQQIHANYKAYGRDSAWNSRRQKQDFDQTLYIYAQRDIWVS